MLYWRYSANRTFFINEYWIFIPSALLIDYLVIRYIRNQRLKDEELKRLISQLEREKKIKKLLLLGLGLTITSYPYLLTRGGSENLIDVDYIKSKFKIDKGIKYLDDSRLRKIIIDKYGYKGKRKGKDRIIFITATALSHLAN